MTGKTDVSAAEVVTAYLTAQLGRLTAAESGVRDGVPDSVHQMRVACRRLRTGLRTFRPLLDRAQTDPLRDELRWLASGLGRARDAEVQRTRLTAELDEAAEPAARERIARELESRYRAAHRKALRQLDSARYADLIGRLQAMTASPPFTPAAADMAADRLPRLARKAYKTVRRRQDEVAAAATTKERERALHEVRKAAKRARYVGEALAPVLGSDAAAFAAAFENVQDALGDHQDSVVIRTTLEDLLSHARDAGEDTFTFGVLSGREEARRAEALERYEEAWEAASDKRLRRWLT